jgi:hypothetical protein
MADNFLTFESANSEYMTIPNGSIFPMGTNDFSVSFWVKVASFPGAFKGIIGDRAALPGQFWGIENTASGIRGWVSKSAAPPSYTTEFTFDTNTWTHIVMTFENNYPSNDFTLVFYKNTVEEETYTPASNPQQFNFTLGSNIDVGSLYTTQSFFDGSLDDIRIYNKIINSTEISDIYNGGTGVKMDGSEDGLIWGSNCDDGTGTTVTNISDEPGGSNATLSTTNIWELGGIPITIPDPEPEPSTIFIDDKNNFTDGYSNLSGRRISASLQEGRSDGALTLGSSL